ncbi:MAG: hypothetical protein ACFFD4_03930 [Candidatus Odinarchaeota archaeon]
MNKLSLAKNSLIIVFLYYILVFLATMGVLSIKTPLLVFLQALLVFIWIIAGKTALYRCLPAHFLTGKLVWKTSEQRGGENTRASEDLVNCFEVKQAPAQQLKDFFISLGRHDYAIWKRAGYTLLAFYPDKKKKEVKPKSKEDIKEMLIRVFPGLMIEDAGFERVLGLPPAKVDENYGESSNKTADSLSNAGRQLLTGNCSTSIPVTGEFALDVEAELSTGEQKTTADGNSEQAFQLKDMNVKLDTNLLEPLLAYFSSEGNRRFVTGAFIGPACSEGRQTLVETYVLFPTTETLAKLTERVDALRTDMDKRDVVNDAGERVTITALFAGLRNTAEPSSVLALRKLMEDYASSDIPMPLVVLEHGTMDLEAFISKMGENIGAEDVDLHESLERVPIKLVN